MRPDIFSIRYHLYDTLSMILIGSISTPLLLTDCIADHTVQILSGVGYAHNQHICHRDLKLENILLKGRTLAHVKIADFGLSDFYRCP